MRRVGRLATALAGVCLVGCGSDDSIAPSGPSRGAVVVQSAIDTVRCAPAYEATCYTDAQLAAAVTRHDGAVFVGIAPAGFPHPFAALRTRRSPSWDSVSFELQLSRLKALGVQVDRRFRHLAVVAAHVPPQLAVDLRRLPTTWFIEPQFPRDLRWGETRGPARENSLVVSVMSTEGYPNLSAQQLRDWGVSSIGAPDAWTLGFRGERMDAGVLDGEPLESHPDLQAGPPDGLKAIRMTGQFTSEPFGNQTGHATWVVGAIVARNNAFGTVGAAPSARVLAAKVCTASGQCPPVSTLDALYWMAVNPEIDVVNMSYGGANGTCSITEHLALKEVVDSGKVVVTAGGEGSIPTRDKSPYGCYDESDDDGPYDPPGIAGLINVSAHDIRGEPATYTWYDDPGKDLSIGGPGGDDQDGFLNENPYSTFVTGQVVTSTCGDFSGDGYAPCRGTSMAAPYVSAAVLLIRQKNPTLTPAQVESSLELNVASWPCVLRQPCGARTPAYTWFGTGKVNVTRVFAAQPSLTVTISGRSSVRPQATCTWYAASSGGRSPYTYRWQVDGLIVGSNSNELNYTAGTASFTISVTATDAGGATASDVHPVTVSSSASVCPI